MSVFLIWYKLLNVQMVFCLIYSFNISYILVHAGSFRHHNNKGYICTYQTVDIDIYFGVVKTGPSCCIMKFINNYVSTCETVCILYKRPWEICDLLAEGRKLRKSCLI